MLRRRIRADEGFTLPELIITMAIVGIIMLPLAQIVITYMLNSETIRARQFESKDQQLASQYWSSDVDSVGQRDTSGSTPTFAAQPGINTGDCTPAPVVPGKTTTKQISFQWTTPSFTSPSVTVSYATTSVTYWTVGTMLVRTSCPSGGSAATATIANTLQIDAAHPLGCNTDGSTTTFGGCSTISGDGHTGVFMHFYVADASGKGQGYWATLVGQRRQTP